jgi:two-component sensor histidine kinase
MNFKNADGRREMLWPQDLDEILATVLEEGRRLLEVISSSIWLIDPDTNELVCKHAVGPGSGKVRGWRLSPGQGIAGMVADTGESLIIADTWSDERHFKGVDKKTGQPLRSILCVPLKVKQKVIGVLQVLDTETDKFSVTDQAMEELLAAEASIAIENSQLYDQLRQNAQTEAILLHQLNHRVQGNLETIKDLFSFVKRHAGLKKRPFLQDLVADLFHRVESLETAHKMVTEFDWNPLPLSGLSIRVIQASLEAVAPKKEVTIEVSPSPVQISPKQANSLALIIHELVMNTVEYAIGDRETGRITVYINRMGDTVQFEFRDDGPGYPEDILRFDHHNVGLYLIQKITRKDLHGELVIHNDDGAVTIVRFNPQENSKTK